MQSFSFLFCINVYKQLCMENPANSKGDIRITTMLLFSDPPTASNLVVTSTDGDCVLYIFAFANVPFGCSPESARDGGLEAMKIRR